VSSSLADVGDFGKYALLNALAECDLRLRRKQVLEEYFDTAATTNKTPLAGGSSSVNAHVSNNNFFQSFVEQPVHGEARVGTSRPLGNVLNKKTPLP
jgi:hypothetical protein